MGNVLVTARHKAEFGKFSCSYTYSDKQFCTQGDLRRYLITGGRVQAHVWPHCVCVCCFLPPVSCA